jgi:uncharacterized membrane protein
MKIARIISLISGVFYLWGLIILLIITPRISSVYEDMNINYNYTALVIVVLIIGVMLVAANFGYYIYLLRKEKKGEEVRNALIYSLIISLTPILSLYLLSIIADISLFLSISNAF